MNPSPNASPSQASPGPPAPSTGGMRLTPLDPVRVLKQYKTLLIVAGVVGVVLSIATYFVLLKLMPRYTAQSIVSVTPELEDPMATTGGGAINERAMEMFKLTQAYLIGSETTLSAALNTREVKQTTWYNSYTDKPGERLLELEDIVHIVPVRDTQVIEVNVTTPEKEDSAVICNAIVDAYVERIARQNSDSRSRVQEGFTRHRNLIQDEIDRLEQSMQSMMAENELPSVQTRFTETDYQLQQVLQQVGEVTGALEMARQSYQALMEQKQQPLQGFSAADRMAIEQDPMIRTRNDRILALKEELRVAAERLGPNHRMVKDLQKRVDAVEIERDRELERMLNDYQDVKLTDARNQLSSLEGSLAALETEAAKLREQRRELNTKLVEYMSLQQERDRKLEELERFDELLASLDLMRQDPRAIRVQVQMRAETPNEPSFPDIVVIGPGVTLLVLLLVTGLVFLKELLDQRIKTPSCTKLLPKANLLGVIPHAEEDPSGAEDIELVVSRQPGSLLAESFRQLRTDVLARMDQRGHKTLMLVGSQAGGGVSATAANLASSVAMNNRKVVVVDANFRRASQHENFGLPEVPGFGDLLTGSSTLDQAIQHSHVPNLDVISIGRATSGNVLEILAGPACRDALHELQNRYDLVIIDAPPMSIVGDSRVLANCVDAVLLVIRANVEKRGLVSRMLGQLRDAKAEVLGLVLNGVRTSAGGYFRRNYRAFYEYQNSRGPARSKPGTPSRMPDARARAAADNLASMTDRDEADRSGN